MDFSILTCQLPPVTSQLEEEQVRAYVTALDKILPWTKEGLDELERVRNVLSEKLKTKSEKLAAARAEKEEMMRKIEMRIEELEGGKVRVES